MEEENQKFKDENKLLQEKVEQSQGSLLEKESEIYIISETLSEKEEELKDSADLVKRLKKEFETRDLTKQNLIEELQTKLNETEVIILDKDEVIDSYLKQQQLKSNEINSLQEQLDQLNQLIKSKDIEFEEMRTNLVEKEKSLQLLEFQIQEKVQIEEKLSQEIKKHLELITQNQTQEKFLKEKIGILENLVLQAQTQVEELNEEKVNFNNQIIEKDSSILVHTNKISELSSSLHEKELQISEFEDKVIFYLFIISNFNFLKNFFFLIDKISRRRISTFN